MTQEEAIQHLREFMWGLQRYRSVVLETLGPGSGELHMSEEFMGEMWPWVFGEKCPLPALSKILDGVDSGGDLTPVDYYNMMTILDRFMPEVRLAMAVWRGTFTIPEEPPAIGLLMGWEER